MNNCINFGNDSRWWQPWTTVENLQQPWVTTTNSPKPSMVTVSHVITIINHSSHGCHQQLPTHCAWQVNPQAEATPQVERSEDGVTTAGQNPEVWDPTRWCKPTGNVVWSIWYSLVLNSGSVQRTVLVLDKKLSCNHLLRCSVAVNLETYSWRKEALTFLPINCTNDCFVIVCSRIPHQSGRLKSSRRVSQWVWQAYNGLMALKTERYGKPWPRHAGSGQLDWLFAHAAISHVCSMLDSLLMFWRSLDLDENWSCTCQLKIGVSSRCQLWIRNYLKMACS